MNQKVYCMYDRVAEEYGPMFVARNDGCAVRAVKNDIGKNVDNLDDYWLMYLGEYNTMLGKISAAERPCRVELDPVAFDKQVKLMEDVKNE